MQLPALLFGVYMKEKKPNARLTKHAKQEMNHLNHQGQKASILRLMVQLVHTFHPPHPTFTPHPIVSLLEGCACHFMEFHSTLLTSSNWLEMF